MLAPGLSEARAWFWQRRWRNDQVDYSAIPLQPCVDAKADQVTCIDWLSSLDEVVDRFADRALFRFPDSSKILNDRVDLTWQASELYGLLFFELLRDSGANLALKDLARRLNAESAADGGHLSAALEQQEVLVRAIAGEYMGKDRKRGRVYTWVPLHLGDAANNCSPRTFLTAWKTAAERDEGVLERIRETGGLAQSACLSKTAWTHFCKL